MPAERNRRRLAGIFWHAALGVWLWAGSLLWPNCALAQAALEYEVKAAFLLNFTKFIEWPANAFAAPDSPFTICILGKDPFGRALDQIVEGESIAGRKLMVRRISQDPEPQTCQVVFISNGEKEVRRILSGLMNGVLTIGEGENFIRAGGMIAFAIENRRVRFDINQTAAESAGLKLSSKLLTVARTVDK